MRRRSVLAWASIALVALACAAPASWAAKPGGTLVILTTPEPSTITNAFNSATTVAEIGTKIFDGLLEYDADANPLPGLAESWSIGPDGKEITFKLRSGV